MMPWRRLLAGLVLMALAQGAMAHEGEPTGLDGTLDFPVPVLGPVHAAFADDLTAAALQFIDLLDADQRKLLMRPFDDAERVRRRDASQTPSFCAVLAWCKAWGLAQCDLSVAQQQALQALLATALSDSGYQTERAIMNRQRIIGELEDSAEQTVITEAGRICPDEHAVSAYDIPEACLPEGVATMPEYVGTGGDSPAVGGGSTIDWSFALPGTSARREQFCQYAIAMFGAPGDDRWAVRFEGHHITVNVTMLRDPDTGAYVVHQSPMFLGSFPMVVPPSPDPENLTLVLSWENGQPLLSEPIDHARQFLLHLPGGQREAARLPVDTFPQMAPLLSATPPPWLAGTLEPHVSLAVEEGETAHVAIAADALGGTARYHLAMIFQRFFATMHPETGAQYARALAARLDGGEAVVLIWSGDDPLHGDGALFMHARVGPLVVELQANHQWSVQHSEAPIANHVHSMFRDLSFPWDFDALRDDGQHHDDEN